MNSRFVEISETLKSIDVVNHDFMLRLDNPILEKVDPFGNPDAHYQHLIVEECKNNVWYFMREIIDSDHMRRVLPLDITFDAQSIVMILLKSKGKDIYVESGNDPNRRLVMYVYAIWDMMFNSGYSLILDTTFCIHRINKSLPYYMFSSVMQRGNLEDTCINGGYCKTHRITDSFVNPAKGIACGSTFKHVIFNDFGRTNFNREIMNELKPSVEQAKGTFTYIAPRYDNTTTIGTNAWAVRCSASRFKFSHIDKGLPEDFYLIRNFTIAGKKAKKNG